MGHHLTGVCHRRRGVVCVTVVGLLVMEAPPLLRFGLLLLLPLSPAAGHAAARAARPAQEIEVVGDLWREEDEEDDIHDSLGIVTNRLQDSEHTYTTEKQSGQVMHWVCIGTQNPAI